jgi:hypothetical protein
MKKASTLPLLAAMVVIVVSALLAAPAFAKPKVKKVKFAGTPAEPTLTITGEGMGSIPTAEDEPAPECLEAGPPTGENFGTSVHFSDENQGWTAGQNGDCIGLVVSTFTETEVVFKFGSNYSQYTPIAKKDVYNLSVNGLAKKGKVSIKKPPKA